MACALAAVGLKIADSVNGSLDPDAPIVLTGRVQAATRTGAARAKARIELMLANNTSRTVTPLLRLAVAPPLNTESRRRRLSLEPRSTRTVRVTLRVACGAAVRAELSGAGVPRRAVTLRIACTRR